MINTSNTVMLKGVNNEIIIAKVPVSDKPIQNMSKQENMSFFFRTLFQIKTEISPIAPNTMVITNHDNSIYNIL